MGLYDYIGGEQIKIFPVPHFYKGNIAYSGGSLLSFDKNDELPLKTLYYQYPENFIVYNFRQLGSNEFEYIWMFRNGSFSHFKKIDTLSEDDLVGPVYDYYGHPLNISKLNDFILMHKESKEASEKDKEVEFSLFPKGSLDTIRNNYKEYQTKETEWNRVKYKYTRDFSNKWFVKNDDIIESTFGAVLECFIHVYNDLSPEEIDYFDPNKKHDECVKYIQSYIKEHPNIVERYKKWLDKENPFYETAFEDIIQGISLTK